jgi:hypothetical protein
LLVGLLLSFCPDARCGYLVLHHAIFKELLQWVCIPMPATACTDHSNTTLLKDLKPHFGFVVILAQTILVILVLAPVQDWFLATNNLAGCLITLGLPAFLLDTCCWWLTLPRGDCHRYHASGMLLSQVLHVLPLYFDHAWCIR